MHTIPPASFSLFFNTYYHHLLLEMIKYRFIIQHLIKESPFYVLCTPNLMVSLYSINVAENPCKNEKQKVRIKV